MHLTTFKLFHSTQKLEMVISPPPFPSFNKKKERNSHSRSESLWGRFLSHCHIIVSFNFSFCFHVNPSSPGWSRPSVRPSIISTTSMEPFVHVSVQAVDARGAHHGPGWWKGREKELGNKEEAKKGRRLNTLKLTPLRPSSTLSRAANVATARATLVSHSFHHASPIAAAAPGL